MADAFYSFEALCIEVRARASHSSLRAAGEKRNTHPSSPKRPSVNNGQHRALESGSPLTPTAVRRCGSDLLAVVNRWHNMNRSPRKVANGPPPGGPYLAHPQRSTR